MLEKEHSIQKVFVEVNTKSKKLANEYKNSIENFLQEEIFPEIEKYFNSKESENGEFLQQQIANLNIEVNISSTNQSLSYSSTKQEIKEQILAKLKEIVNKPELHDVAINTITVSQSKVDEFFYFLQYGTTAWWNTTKGESFTKKRLFEITESQNFEERFLRALSSSIQKERLIQQFTNEELHILFLGVFNKPEGYVEFLSSIKGFNFTSYQIKNKVWKLFVEAILSKDFSRIKDEIREGIKESKVNSLHNDQKELTNFLKLLTSKSTLFVNQLKNEKLKRNETIGKRREAGEGKEKVVEKKEEKVTTGDKVRVDDKEHTNDEKAKKKSTLKEKEISHFNSSNEVKGFESQDQKNILEEETSKKENKSIKKEELKIKEQKDNKSIYKNKKEERSSVEEKVLKEQKRADYQRRHQEALKNTFLDKVETNESTSYIVKNAGLILLHPFLKQFFKSCDFLDKENKIIKSNEAVHLLHYVATKKEQQFENNLIFEKFLCNLPIQSPIERSIVLTDDLKEKSEELLKAVLQNWGVLKNSSTDLLRNEYIQREGKLDLTKDNPTLTVERKTQDILIDTKLPWNLSMCKLPWMKELIFTNW